MQSFWDHFESSQDITKSYTFHQFFETLETAVDTDHGSPLNQAAKVIRAKFHPEVAYYHQLNETDVQEKNTKDVGKFCPSIETRLRMWIGKTNT